MGNLADLHAPHAVDIPPPELHEAILGEDATAPGQEVKCVVPSFDPLKATDPMLWTPYVTGAGVFYPKRGDRAILGYPPDGPPVILAWWPKATTPDVSF